MGRITLWATLRLTSRRFSQDMTIIDTELPYSLIDFCFAMIGVIMGAILVRHTLSSPLPLQIHLSQAHLCKIRCVFRLGTLPSLYRQLFSWYGVSTIPRICGTMLTEL